MSGSTQLWHHRFGHMSDKGLQVLMNPKLIPNLKTQNFMFRSHCIFGKKCTQKFEASSHDSKGVLSYIHSYLWGPYPTIFYGGAKYYVLFVYYFSRKV